MDDLVPPIHCATCSTMGGGSGEISGLTQRSEGVIGDAEYDTIYKHFFNVQLQNEPQYDTQSARTKPKTITKPRYHHRRHARNHSITKRGKSGRKTSDRLSNKKSKRVKRHTIK